jgi:salicylate hydroxylase
MFQAGWIHQPDHLYKGRRASLPLNIVVIGCGLGGLAASYCLAQAGHTITILEAASAIGEVGAGVQASPNVSRLLMRWGLGPRLEELGVKIQAISLKRCELRRSVLVLLLDVNIQGPMMRWSGGRRLGMSSKRNTVPLSTSYTLVLSLLHICLLTRLKQRADFHRMLYSVTESYCNIRVNSRVVSVDPLTPSVTLASGEVVTADLIIGADGVKSVTREYVVGGPDKPRVTGDAAYRALIPTEKLLQDDELKPLVEKMESNIWMGPGGHIVGYTIVS